MVLLSRGGYFKIYDLFLTGYIAPGLNRSGLLTTTTESFFGSSGIGIGGEIITIDTDITELVPSWMRRRAFAVNQAVTFIACQLWPVLAWWLAPLSLYGINGWRWVVLIGAAASMEIWILRLWVVESPLWRTASPSPSLQYSFILTFCVSDRSAACHKFCRPLRAQMDHLRGGRGNHHLWPRRLPAH